MSSRTVVSRYLAALATREFAAAPLAEDVTFQDPISNGIVTGRAAVIAFFECHIPQIDSWSVQLELADGEYVALAWTPVTADEAIRIFEYFRLSGDEIVEIRAYYDPASLPAAYR